MTVFTNGCFDILHRGHIEMLSFCKWHAGGANGQVVVGLNSDASVKKLKGENRPINNQEDRKRFLECIRFVDDVLFFEEDTPYNLIKSVKPDIIVKGGDYRSEDVVGGDLCRVEIFNYIENYSTTKIISALERK